MNRQNNNSYEDVKKYHKTMGAICLKIAEHPEEVFFMNIYDNERRRRMVKGAVPDGEKHLGTYGGDPILAVVGYYVHQAIAHFEIIGDMHSFERANRVRTARNIAYDIEMVQIHKNERLNLPVSSCLEVRL